ncbi:histidine kinase [Adhaeribacter swui]|uniref:Histidine kinase n=1 Tax=Adhaeribacter swui TaxID=2086471 RepID=A0A7G7G504_9BACT|nr:histidine kinase [Adhaeribacter swui]QNF32238.1 histidine kinase [Adhaeribacter swui]
MNAAQVDLQQLRIKHILYKAKVRSAVYGGSYDAAFFSRLGPVNTWFDSVGLLKYKNEPEMRELNGLQQEINLFVNHLTDLYKRGKIDEAYDGLSVIEEKSIQFLNLVTLMEQRLGD